MSQLEHKTGGALPSGSSGKTPKTLAELREIRRIHKATNMRVEELKLRILQMTEHHLDQIIYVIHKWIKGENKEK